MSTARKGKRGKYSWQWENLIVGFSYSIRSRAEVAELVDALGSGSSVGSHVGVRVPSSAPYWIKKGVIFMDNAFFIWRSRRMMKRRSGERKESSKIQWFLRENTVFPLFIPCKFLPYHWDVHLTDSFFLFCQASLPEMKNGKFEKDIKALCCF